MSKGSAIRCPDCDRKVRAGQVACKCGWTRPGLGGGARTMTAGQLSALADKAGTPVAAMPTVIYKSAGDGARTEDRRPVATKRTPRGRYRCWSCGTGMKKKRRICAGCKKRRPAAVKAQMASLVKSYGGKPPVVKAAGPAKGPKPVCPHCGKKGSRKASCCPRCGTAFTAASAARAQKRAEHYQAGVPGSAASLEKAARVLADPQGRHAWESDAARVRAARGEGDLHAATVLQKAYGAVSLRDLYHRLRHDPGICADPGEVDIVRRAIEQQRAGGYR